METRPLPARAALVPGGWPPTSRTAVHGPLTWVFDRFHQDPEVLFICTQACNNIFNPPEILLYLRLLLRTTGGGSFLSLAPH